MAEFLLRPKAVADLDSIWDYTVDTWSEEQAERYIWMLHSGFESIAREPARGRPCDEIRDGYRKHRVGHHVIFYQALETGGVDVVRVLHENMDFERHL
jgi:toxin ParE1/3/4